MSAEVFYNEFDPNAAAWLRNLIAAGEIPAGEVDERTIVRVRVAQLARYRQCHFFAGIGGWSLALRVAGWDPEREVWTASLPCQPFSSAGKRKGFADKRHLWPTFFKLVDECRPESIFGEQVDSKDGRAWLVRVQADLEGIGYAFGRASLNAAGAGAPHIRQRLYWCAYRRDLPDGLALPAGYGRRGGVMEIRPGTTGKYKLRDEAPLAGWTTPQAHDTNPRGAGNRENPRGGACLGWDAKLAGWASPTASKTTQSGELQNKDGPPWGGVTKPYQNGQPVTTALGDQVKLVGWATPSVFLAAGDPEKVKKRRAKAKEDHGNGNGFGLNLEQQAQSVTEL